MTRGALDITVNGEGVEGAPTALLERAVVLTLRDGGVGSAELSVTLLADPDIRALNARYLGRDRPTDVIAFALGTGDQVLGDVYIGHQQAERQARELGVALDEELVRLAVHGTLHVLGHDHPEGPEREASPMFVRQEGLVRAVMEQGVSG